VADRTGPAAEQNKPKTTKNMNKIQIKPPILLLLINTMKELNAWKFGRKY
jgi:hypothetical protein